MSLSHQLVPQEDPDLERQPQLDSKDARSAPSLSVEDTISTRSKMMQLGFYFLCNVALTIYNKLILGKVSLLQHQAEAAATVTVTTTHPHHNRNHGRAQS